MFETKELETIKRGLAFSKSKNDELTAMLGWEEDEEVEEINALIATILKKIADGSQDFSEEEISEIRTGIMGLLAQDIDDTEVSDVLGKLNTIMYGD